jgi:hypothetical protein
MTGVLLDRPLSLYPDAAGGTSVPESGSGRGRLTLEELLDATLDAARTKGSAECPVCHARMTYTRAGADCGGCGSRLN